MHSIPIIVLGVVFILGGAVIAGLAFQQPKKDSAAPPKKSELRAQEVDKKNNVKQLIGGAILAVFGLVLILVVA